MSFTSEVEPSVETARAPEAPAEPERPSRWSDVWFIAATQLLGGVGTFLVMTTFLISFQQRGASGLEVAALVICEALPVVLLGVPVGKLVDRVDSRLLLVVAGLGQAATCLVLSRVSGLTAVLAGVVGLSISSAIVMPTRQGLLPTVVRRADLPRAAAVGQTAASMGMMAGPALAGFLVGSIGPQWTVRWAVVGFLVTVVASFAIRTRRGGRPQTVAKTNATSTVDSATDWNIRQDPLVWTSVWGLAIVVTAVAALNVVLVYFVMGTLHSQPRDYGVIDSMFPVGLLIGAWLGGMLVKPGTGDVSVARGTAIAAVWISVAVTVVGFAQVAWWIIPCYLVGGSANGILSVCATTLLGRRVPKAARGRAGATLGALTQGGSLIGYIAGGLLLSVVAPRWIVVACGVLGIMAALAMFPALARAAARVRAASDLVEAHPAA